MLSALKHFCEWVLECCKVYVISLIAGRRCSTRFLRMELGFSNRCQISAFLCVQLFFFIAYSCLWSSARSRVCFLCHKASLPLSPPVRMFSWLMRNFTLSLHSKRHETRGLRQCTATPRTCFGTFQAMHDAFVFFLYTYCATPAYAHCFRLYWKPCCVVFPVEAGPGRTDRNTHLLTAVSRDVAQK